ncbi:DHH family phosphoesterase [Oenococcus sicerae]|uniref:DHH family phosphoesterase n=1 Tax=Oenococcus sicerae TaxID=2203724 RepID=UPI0010B352CF|nr:putative bifunctional oligoribonuclease and PAP phosphatase NrnA [Oenococcus sicerae]
MDIQEKILRQIEKYQTIIIHRHQRPDPDAIGSQLGLKAGLQATFPEKNVYAVGKEITGLTWVGSMDKVADSIYDNALVIVIDTANSVRIDDDRFNKGDALIKIDHHPNDEPYGDLMWVEPTRSSCSEMVTFFLDTNLPLQLTQDSARDLYIGLVGDTGRFMYASTPETLIAASKLYRFAIDFEKINRRMSSISLVQARFSAVVYGEMKVEDAVGWITLTRAEIEAAHLGSEGTNFIVGMFGAIKEVTAWANFIENDDGSFRVRLRSKGPNVNEIAKLHNGGGHDMASGAKAKDLAEIDQIVKELKTSTEAFKKQSFSME